MSKLKMVLVSGEIVALYCVPSAVSGELEETGTMR